MTREKALSKKIHRHRVRQQKTVGFLPFSGGQPESNLPVEFLNFVGEAFHCKLPRTQQKGRNLRDVSCAWTHDHEGTKTHGRDKPQAGTRAPHAHKPRNTGHTDPPVRVPSSDPPPAKEAAPVGTNTVRVFSKHRDMSNTELCTVRRKLPLVLHGGVNFMDESGSFHRPAPMLARQVTDQEQILRLDWSGFSFPFSSFLHPLCLCSLSTRWADSRWADLLRHLPWLADTSRNTRGS